MKQYFCLEVRVSPGDVEQATGILTLRVPFGWEEEPLPQGETLFRIHCEEKNFLKTLQQELQTRIPAASGDVRAVEQRDWLAAWRQFFTPVPCGSRFVVLPPWLADTPAFPDRTPVLIEPRSAFGTGHHATTALCLTVISDLLDTGRLLPGQRFLDLGTGSGILAIACAKSGLTGLGCDIDPLAVDNARENCALNGVDDCVTPLTGSLDALGDQHGPFDLIVANILAQPLIELAPGLVPLLGGRTEQHSTRGCLLLSGILATQADAVENAYMAEGLPAPRRVHEDEWCALVWT